MSQINDFMRRLMEDQHGITEIAVEESLQHGLCGVALVHREDLTSYARVHPYIPYGKLFIFPSEESYEKWQANL